MIVILGILASVAIPRLAATREDAEISTAIANIRTLISEVNAYYVGHGTFGPADTGARWSDVTNVPLDDNTARAVGTGTDATAQLRAGNADCVGVRLVNKNGATPAHIIFTRGDGDTANSVCRQVLDSAPVAVYLRSTQVATVTGSVAIGSSTGIYQPAPTPDPEVPGGAGAPGTVPGG